MTDISLDGQGLPQGYELDVDRELTPRQVKAMLDAGEPLILLDCRMPQEHAFVRLGDELGAPVRLMPLHEAPARINELRQLADRKVVVYCHHGVRSLQMTEWLRQLGVRDSHSMAGGLDLWALDVQPGMARY